jgi:hypothetical protein
MRFEPESKMYVFSANSIHPILLYLKILLHCAISFFFITSLPQGRNVTCDTFISFAAGLRGGSIREQCPAYIKNQESKE